ncbi:MAG: putative ABC transporter permease [Ruminococcus sp.]|nr:putative ABC transporter permease [Ruminococcus sp.]MDY3895359.1 putative ABC transporter permease [Candidatus Fimenecus sp.]
MSGKNTEKTNKNLYADTFCLFMVGNIFGVLLEGIWCVIKNGKWETHTVTMFGPFCLIYGIGAALIYLLYTRLKKRNVFIKFIAVALCADVVEYACSCLIDYCVHMKAWDYTNCALNLNGRITLGMTVVWGVLGVIFMRFAAPHCEKLFSKMHKRPFYIGIYLLSVLMAVNIAFTAVCITRWSQRHFGTAKPTAAGQFLDRHYPDEKMQNRFCEWSFLDN